MAHEVGNFSDNASLVAIAASAIERGAVDDALPVLRDLRERMNDAKSRRWLLPEVNRLIKSAEASSARHRVSRGRRRVSRRRPTLAGFEPTLVRVGSLISLSATVIRIVVHEVLSIFPWRQ